MDTSEFIDGVLYLTDNGERLTRRSAEKTFDISSSFTELAVLRSANRSQRHHQPDQRVTFCTIERPFTPPTDFKDSNTLSSITETSEGSWLPLASSSTINENSTSRSIPTPWESVSSSEYRISSINTGSSRPADNQRGSQRKQRVANPSSRSERGCSGTTTSQLTISHQYLDRRVKRATKRRKLTKSTDPVSSITTQTAANWPASTEPPEEFAGSEKCCQCHVVNHSPSSVRAYIINILSNRYIGLAGYVMAKITKALVV